MKNTQIPETTTPRHTVEEQLLVIAMLTKNAEDLLEKMKRENPEVVEWIRQGKPPL